MAARLKALAWILVMLAVGYVGLQVIPAWYANYQLQNDIEQIAIAESYTARPASEVQQIIAARASAYGIPLRPEQIRVQKGGGQLAISIEYTVHIDIPVYPFEVTFHPGTKNKRL